MLFKKVKEMVSFLNGGAALFPYQDIELLVPYPWETGDIASSFKKTVEQSPYCPTGHTVNIVENVKEV